MHSITKRFELVEVLWCFFLQHVNLQYVLYTVIMYTTYHNIAINDK